VETDEALVTFFLTAIERARAADAAAEKPSAAATDSSAALVPAADSVPAPEDAEFAAECDKWQAEALKQRDALVAAALETGVASSSSVAEAALQIAERRISSEVQCGICFEPVASAPNKRFGLLTGCSHAYCLDCIRQWRGRIDLPKETVRSCPLCRVTSYFVVPCDRYISDPARKAALNADYHKQQAAIPCRYFDGGKGECPFGSSCWYAHINPDGSTYVHVKPAIRLDGEGAVTVGRKYRLNEFL
jgi:hypothetical protein